jgi:hypothetical protein
MDKQMVGSLVMLGGIIGGAIVGFLLVKQHPVHIGMLAFTALVYFAGKYYRDGKL